MVLIKITKDKMEANAQSSPKINFHIENFTGDPEKTEWFISQVKDVVKINQWGDEIAILFLKSKLASSAQTWCSSSPECRNIEKFEELCDKIKVFFSNKPSADSNLKAFQACRMEFNETVKNYAFRIEVLAHKAYPFITDATVMNEIKSMQLLANLPKTVKERLTNIDKTKFNEIVNIADSIHRDFHDDQQTNFLDQRKNPKNNDIDEIKSKIEMLTIAMADNLGKCQWCMNPKHPMNECEIFNQIMSNRNKTEENQNKSENDKYMSMCAYCNKKGHHMAKCFEFKNLMRGQNQNKQFRGNPNFRQNFQPQRRQDNRFNSKHRNDNQNRDLN